ncbi:hypothetical protein J6590_034027 [Homalodisca vitripennis]|nr:hypothetical protein J6590_034027 [Homalodisca vitripennis]
MLTIRLSASDQNKKKNLKINLKTNSSKSNVINCCLRQQEQNLRPEVMVDDFLLEESESIKFLGMWPCTADLNASWHGAGMFTNTGLEAGITFESNSTERQLRTLSVTTFVKLLETYRWGSSGQTTATYSLSCTYHRSVTVTPIHSVQMQCLSCPAGAPGRSRDKCARHRNKRHRRLRLRLMRSPRTIDLHGCPPETLTLVFTAEV